MRKEAQAGDRRAQDPTGPAAKAESSEATGLMMLPMMAADGLRFVVDLAVYGVALLPAGVAVVLLWRVGNVWCRLLALPAGYVGFVLGFYCALVCLRIVFLRKIAPGTYRLTDRQALRWIIADSLMRLFERSFLRGYVKDFAFQRYLFYRMMGAKIDRTFLIGWDVKILDPWALEVGRDALIGSFAVISGHSVEGDSVFIKKVKIGDRAIVGMRAVILPGVEVGDGAVVGAGALVVKDTKIPPGEIWGGVPAKRIGVVAGSARADLNADST